MTLTNFPPVIILIALLIFITGWFSQYFLGQGYGDVDDDYGKQSLGDASINYLSQNLKKLLEEIKGGLASISYPIQNNVISSGRFEGPVKIIENGSVPTINDPSLYLDTVVTGLEFPTSMAFLGPDDILVLEKNKGTVRRIHNGNLLPDPLLDVNVGTLDDRGMLGIALAKDKNANRDVFVYFTETSTQDGSDIIENVTNKNYTYDSKEPLGNRLYKFKLVNGSLTSAKLLLNIPAKISGEKNIGIHNGGKVIIGPDDNVYLIVGDIGGFETKTQNVLNNIPLNATSVILRISQAGEATGNILGSKDPTNKFYAYGIRNSFGMDFDPVTGYLWDTENGHESDDEINLVKPGFNSGWSKIMGMSSERYNLNLVNFGGKGNYSDPEFVWNLTVGPTDLKFLNSDKLGNQYVNDMFVGDFNNGYLYHFDLNENRTELMLDGVLKDKIADNPNELKDIVFAKGFGGITDIEVGPDGYLYVLALGETNPQAKIKCDIEIPNPECRKYNDPIRGSLFRIIQAEAPSR